MRWVRNSYRKLIAGDTGVTLVEVLAGGKRRVNRRLYSLPREICKEGRKANPRH